MDPDELLTLGDKWCRIKRREYEPPEVLGGIISGLEALPGYVNPGKRVTLYLECGWCILVLEEYSDFILSKPEHMKHHTLVLPTETQVRCPACSGDFKSPN